MSHPSKTHRQQSNTGLVVVAKTRGAAISAPSYVSKDPLFARESRFVIALLIGEKITITHTGNLPFADQTFLPDRISEPCSTRRQFFCRCSYRLMDGKYKSSEIKATYRIVIYAMVFLRLNDLEWGFRENASVEPSSCFCVGNISKLVSEKFQ